MMTLSRFIAKFTKLIVAVLSCFDRVRFTGHLPISNGPTFYAVSCCRQLTGSNLEILAGLSVVDEDSQKLRAKDAVLLFADAPDR